MASSNAGKNHISKTELLQWLNNSIKEHGIELNKIEALGTGIGYLFLLNYLHPSSVPLQKINKKPLNEYEYQANLKLLALTFVKLGINRPIDIEKLSKMKLQDNLELLQWFHKYSLQENEQLKAQNANKKMKMKAPDKISLDLIGKGRKMDIEETQDVELKLIRSPSGKINQIYSIINDEPSTDESKLSKIMEILNMKTKMSSQLSEGTPIKELIREPKNMFSTISIFDNQINENRQTKEVTYVKCTKLESKYEELLKKSMMKNDMEPKSYNRSKSKQNSVRINPKSEIFEYEDERNEGRLTDTSYLLQSDRKSVQSETCLLPDI